MKVLVIDDFYLKAILFQPIYDEVPYMGFTSSEKLRKFQKGEIIDLRAGFRPTNEETSDCASVYGGLLTYGERVPIHKIVTIIDKNCEMAEKYSELQGKIRLIEKQIRETESLARDADNAIMDAETMEEVIMFFKHYAEKAAEAACLRMEMESMLMRMQTCEERLKRSRKISLLSNGIEKND